MIRRIVQLLPKGQRKRGIWVAFSVLARAVLDFAGVAALIPILLVVMKQNGGRGMMLALCGAVLLFVVLKNALVVFLARVQSRYQLEIYRDFSRRMFANYYHRGLLFLKGKSSVQLGHEVNYVCYTFSSCVLAPVFRMAGEAVLALLMVSALVAWEPLAGLLLCASFFPLAALYVGLVRKRLRRYGMEELEARRKQNRTVVEAFRGYAELEIARAFHTSLDSFDQGMEFIVRNRLRTEAYQLFPSFLSEIAVVGGLALLIGTGNGNLGLMSGVFAVAAFRLIPAVRGILNSWVTLQNASHTITVVEEGISNEPRQEVQSGASFTFKHGIELHRLGFAFSDGHALFNGLDLHIRCGERIGIRGASGAGKSTLFNLMLGFFPPTSGKILIDGRELTAANRSEWHKLVGYVPQEIFIIEGTLADNVALGQPQADRRKVAQVLEQVQLGEWADELPQGLDTPLGEYGSRLSGGQKQRIGIARALYKEAEVLFFDEATSALDNRTEQEINHALETLSLQYRELTLVVIAHRESSLAFCDRIFDLDACQIVHNNQGIREMEQDYLIAGHRIRVEGDRLVTAVDALTGFAPFKAAVGDEPLCRFMESAGEAPAFEETLYANEIDGIASRFGRYANGFLFVMAPPEGGTLEVWLDENRRVASFKGNYNLRLLRFACWIAYGVATTPFGTVAIHTSAIQYQGKAVLFLGESGTGKSTHTRLWRENIEGAVLLNDDSPILRIIDGKPWVYGSPWSGKTPCYKNEHYPLAACVRLSQAPYNQIKKLSVVQGYGALHPSCPPDFAYSDELYDYISSTLSSLLSAVPVYHLACLPDAAAARLSCETIFGACEK